MFLFAVINGTSMLQVPVLRSVHTADISHGALRLEGDLMGGFCVNGQDTERTQIKSTLAYAPSAVATNL